jgi:hypothetical protein
MEKLMSKTPRTDLLLSCQNEDLFYSGTPSNVAEMVSFYKKQTEEHARTLESELVDMTAERDELLKACQDMTAKAIVDEILAERKG